MSRKRHTPEQIIGKLRETSRPLSRESLLPALETILRVNGAALVRNRDFYKIVPLATAARESAPLRAGRSRAAADGFGIRIVPLEYVAAAEMRKILMPLAAEGSILRVDEARNLLVLAGTRRQIGSMLDTGVILRVTARVNAGGLIIMEIEQEVSEVVSTVTAGIVAPTIRQRKITSTVAIQSDETVALGGLISEDRNETRSGIPILSKIPILGALFRSTSETLKRTELLVLITPRVVGTLQQARAVTDELRRRMRAVVPLGAKIE